MFILTVLAKGEKKLHNVTFSGLKMKNGKVVLTNGGQYIAMYYFRWSYLMKDAVYDTFGKINHILADYKYSDRDAIFSFLLYQLSKVHIGYEENDTAKLANHSFRAMAGMLEDAIKEKADSIQDCKILEGYSDNFTAKNTAGEDIVVKIEKGYIKK